MCGDTVAGIENAEIEEYLGVVGGKRLLVAGLHYGNLLPSLVQEKVSAPQSLCSCLRLLPSPQTTHHRLD